MEPSKIADPGNLFYVLSFIVPGFIFSWVFDRLRPRKPTPPSLAVLQFLASSSVIWTCALASRAYLYHANTTALGWLEWLATVFLAPVVLAVVWGWVEKLDLVRKLLIELGFSPSEGYASAWAFKAHRLSRGSWMIVTLTNGALVYGKYGRASNVGTDPTNSDLYLEELWVLENDRWVPVDDPGSDGVYIRATEISTVEFYLPSDVDYGWTPVYVRIRQVGPTVRQWLTTTFGRRRTNSHPREDNDGPAEAEHQ